MTRSMGKEVALLTGKLLFSVGLILAFVWAMGGCRHNPPTTNPTTPYQKVLLYNTGLAQSNQDIAQVVQALEAQKLIELDDARAILTVQFQIAAADKKLTQILVQGQEYATGHASEINELIAEIRLAVNQLVTQGLVGVKDPAKQQLIANDVTAITGLAAQIVTTLQQIGVLKAAGGVPVPQVPSPPRPPFALKGAIA